MENQEYWICPECDNENYTYLIRCAACGYEDINEEFNHKKSSAGGESDNDSYNLIILMLLAFVAGVLLIIRKYMNENPEYFFSYDFHIDVLFLLISWLLLDNFRKERLSYKSQFWPVAHGNLIYAYVEKRNTGYPTYGSAYVPLVQYKYSVDVKTYTSERISFTPIGCYSREDAHRKMLFLDNNDKVKIYYKPSNPKISVLKPGFGKADYNIYLIGLFVFLVLYFLAKLL